MEMFMWKEANGCHDHFVCGYDGKVPNREHSPTMMSSCASSSAIALGYIQHHISKLDTLAGIAIKYGVEVADIKKMNGLVTDRQMFALKTLHIPLHGRHSDDQRSPPYHASHELHESFHSPGIKSSELKLSPSMNSLQDYYGTVPTMKESIREVLEMAVCRKGSSDYSENGSFYTSSPMADQPHQSCHKKSRSLAERILNDIIERSDILVQNLEADLKVTPKLLSRQENSNTCGLSSRTGKGLAPRQKAGSRITLMGDAFIIDGVSSVRKSSSTSCLQGNNSSTYMRPTSRRSLKPDLIASTASIAKPILTGSRSKTALD